MEEIEEFLSDEEITVGEKRKNGSPSSQQQKKKKKDLYKPPTSDEISRLKETENLFNSNLFRLQIEELLKETQVKPKHRTRFNGWFKEFSTFLEQLPDYECMLSEVQKKNRNQSKLFNLPYFEEGMSKSDHDLKLKFQKPSSVTLIGFHSIASDVGPQLEIHVSLQIPKDCFLEKDYLNNRYFIKRWYYLLHLAKAISTTELCSNVTYSHINGSKLLPVMEITPSVAKSIKVTVFPIPVQFVRETRCLPATNNVKLSVFDKFSDIKEAELRNHGTPFYNSMLLHDFTLNTNHSYFKTVLGDLKSVQDALRLLQIWLKQRMLHELPGYPTDMLLYIMSYLVAKRKVNKHMSSYQVIRNFWTFLSTTDLTKDCIGICEDVKPNVYEELHKNFEVVFVDRSGCYNVFAFFDLGSYHKLKSEAKIAGANLDDPRFNSFGSLFITKLPIVVQFDLVVRLHSSDNFHSVYNLSQDTNKYKYVGCYGPLVRRTIIDMLKTGLNKRILHIVPFIPSDNQSVICLAINLNTEHAFKTLELGPHPHDPKAKEFIDFWGKLSHLRRFPDGTTCEAVYFETKNLKDKRSIIKKIMDYLITEKLNLNYDLLFDQFEEVITSNEHTLEENCLKAIAVSEELSKKLRDLSLPLDITSTVGNCDVFSYSDPHAPVPIYYQEQKHLTRRGNNIIFKDENISTVPPHLQPIESIIQFSLNSKWPNSLQAIRSIMTAFYLKIAEILQKEYRIKCNVRPDQLDVYFEGYVYRYRIYLPKEISFLKKHIESDGLVTYKDTDESIALEKKLDMAPKLFSAFRGIQMQNPSYGPSTAIIKRWMRSQLIDDYHFPDIVINMLNASLYVNSGPFALPTLPQVAFLRFLKFMAEYDWNLQPVYLNFGEELPREHLDEIETHFHQNRSSFPSLFIIIPYDGGRSVFTKKSPTTEILRRVKILAGETCKIICSFLTSVSLINIMPLFTPNLEGYNLIIHLKPALNSKRYQSLTFTQDYPSMKEDEKSPIPIIDFNPVDKYLKELRESYDKFALFFHDTYGGNLIGVMWRREALEEKPFKIANVGGCRLKNNKLMLNVDAIAEDFYILGKSVIKRIEKK